MWLPLEWIYSRESVIVDVLIKHKDARPLRYINQDFTVIYFPYSLDWHKFAESFILGKIKVENIRVYAHHGCLPEETVIGSDYLVDVIVNADLNQASKSDDLQDTVDYVHINHIIKEEMKVPSKLLEHVGKRILDRIIFEIPKVKKAEVSVSKINPPIGGDVEKVTVILKEKRKV